VIPPPPRGAPRAASPLGEITGAGGRKSRTVRPRPESNWSRRPGRQRSHTAPAAGRRAPRGTTTEGPTSCVDIACASRTRVSS